LVVSRRVLLKPLVSLVLLAEPLVVLG